MRRLCLGLLLAAPLLALARDDAEWKFDVVHLDKGQRLAGLIVSQNNASVTIRCVSRKRGSPTVTYLEVVPRGEIRRVEPLSEKDRQTLRGRLDALKQEREALAEHLRLLDPKAKGKDREVPLDPVPWPPDAKVEAMGYRSAHFHLVADTRPELASLAAILLEQVYSAYARYLPPRAKGEPTTILLARSVGDYLRIARGRGLDLFNPAFYDPVRNEVVCGSDLERLCDELVKVREAHARLRDAIKERRAELSKAYKGKPPAELLAPLADAERRMPAAEKANEAAFVRVRERLFRRLYHESFHAYLNTFVYPAKDCAVPHWLNEGLAQLFETAIVEVGELRVGHADAGRLSAAKAAAKEGKLLPAADLIVAEPRKFLVAHRQEQQASDQHYLASWALAFHLTFGKKLLGTKKLEDYVTSLKRGADPAAAFAELVGKPAEKFEEEHRAYLRRLKPDGTLE